MLRTLGALGVLWSVGCCGRDHDVKKDPVPAPSSAPGAQARPGWRVRRIEAGSASLERDFPYDNLLPEPAFEVIEGASTIAQVVFSRSGKNSESSPSALAVLEGKARQLAPLTILGEGHLTEVEAFDVRDIDGDGRPEFLVMARFQPPGDPAPLPFRRAIHIERDAQGKLRKSLASYELRNETGFSSLDEFAVAIARSRGRFRCPSLAWDMEFDTTVAALQCMVDGGHKEQVAASVEYPLRVLLPGGEVRDLTEPAQLVAVYEQVFDEAIRKVLHDVDTRLSCFDGPRLGIGEVLLTQSLTVSKDLPPSAPKIFAISSTHAEAHRKLRERLGTDHRWLWKGTSTILCKTKRATHALLQDDHGRLRLATWNNPKASIKSTPPDRVLFGFLESHGTCGNDFYDFIGPEGIVKLTSIACYGPEPTPKHAVTDGSEEEPCENHPILR